MSRSLTNTVVLLLLALPITWAIGVEQFVWFVILPIWLGYLLLRGHVVLSSDTAWARLPVTLLLIAMIVSGASIVGAGPARLVTYVWGVLAYMSGLALFLSLGAGDESRRTSDRLINAAVVGMAVANAAGLIALALGLRQGFEAPFAYLLPRSVRGSDLGSAMFNNSLLRAQPTFLFGVEGTRVKSFFVYPNTYALANDVAIGLSLYVAAAAAQRRRWLKAMGGGLAFVLALAASFASLSRTGIVVTAAGALAVVWIAMLRTAPRVAAMAVVAAVAATGWLGYVFLDEIRLTIDLVLYARGRGSAESRFATYITSVEAVVDRPIGFGTQRDELPGYPVPGLPLGTHSQFIAVLFKHGWLGLSAFLALVGALYSRFMRHAVRHAGGRIGGAKTFYTAATWSMTSVLLHMTFIEIALDMTSFVLIVVLWVAVESRHGYYERLRDDRSPASDQGVSPSMT